MNARIIDGLSNRDYHSMPEISKSGLDRIAKSPAHFKAGFQSIASDTARIGTAAHSMILEGGNDLLLAPDRKRASGADKLFWDTWFEEQGATEQIACIYPAAQWFPKFERMTGKTIVKPDEMDMFKRMQESVMSNDLAASLLSEGKAEQSIVFGHNGVDCRVRPDWITSDHNLVDLKTTQDASARGFRSSCAKYRYHVQDAMYSQGYFKVGPVWPEFYFIAVEKTAPYMCAVYRLSDEARQHGHTLFERDLEVYQYCKENQQWDGYDNVLSLDIPIWDAPEIVENYAELVA